jgi:hypothetical protein
MQAKSTAATHDEYIDGQTLAEAYRPRLPTASIGRSRIRCKRLSDVDTEVLTAPFRSAAANPPAPLS